MDKFSAFGKNIRYARPKLEALMAGALSPACLRIAINAPFPAQDFF